MAKRERRTFTEEFKKQMVQLYQNGKSRKEIIPEYDLTPSSLDKWVGQSQNSGSFKEKDNLTDEQKELMEVRKRNKQLEMENDILKETELEFVKGQHFDSLEELTRELQNYIHWFNHIRIHWTLGYVSPIDYKLEHLKKVV
ncbi:IS3 family transposase [Peribacillus muralis]|uniref:IS3 family transposase n=1 Tax=Peribacillus muralis TaxID=264697 RepID=UPI003CFCCD0E